MQRTKASLIDVFRRGLSAVLCALMLMLAVPSLDVGFDTGSGRAGVLSVLASSDRSDGAPMQQDGLPCECAHHLCGKVTPLPPVLAIGLPSVSRPESPPVWAPAPMLQSGLQDLPAKPPRA